MAAANSSIGGVVLAGGGGRRFGGPKAAVVVGGSTLVSRAVQMLAERCRDVVVVSREGVEFPPLAGARVVLDRPGPDAPLVAVATGLAALDSDVCVVLACDLPFAGPVVDRLLAAPSGPVVAVDRMGRPQPLCGRYPRVATLAVCDRLLAAGRVAMGALLDEILPGTIATGGDELLNVNTPADAARAEAVAAMRRRALPPRRCSPGPGSRDRGPRGG
jgi:molybdopterin-guanine dinucleotide biosynthesis protein A